MNDDAIYWPHAPMHSFSERGIYMVTAGIYQKQILLNSSEKLTLVQDMLFQYATQLDWQIQAWAIMGNHYHFIAAAPENVETLRSLIRKLHEYSAKKLNRMDATPGRKVWHNYWDSHITHQTSYFARLRYVHQNPVHHGAAQNASNYPWCSQNWLEQNFERSFVNTLAHFKTDSVNVHDEF